MRSTRWARAGSRKRANTPSLGLEGDLAAHPVGYGIQKQAFAFGFGKATGVGLSGDQGGRIPTRSFNVDLNKTSTDETAARGAAATARASRSARVTCSSRRCSSPTRYATFANGGTLYTPRIASAVLASGVGLPEGKLGDVVHTLDPQMLRTGLLTPEIRNPILEGLVGAVNNGEGTAYFAFRELLGPDVRGEDRHRAGRRTARSTTRRGSSASPTRRTIPRSRSTWSSRSWSRPASASEVSAPIAARVAEYLTGPARTRPPCMSAPRRARRTDARMIETRT